jgi:F-type H+-transporting ATPase subunit delta
VTAAPRAVARRYARALLDVASSQSAGTAQQLQSELADFASQVAANAELRRVLLNPALPVDARRDRVEILETRAEEYAQALNARQGRISAEAVTAVSLDAAQKDALAAALCTSIGKTVELQARVDEAVLGGVLVKVGGRTYDGTLRARLASLRARLASGR